MAPTTVTSVRVHDAEVSTDRETLAPYVEPLVVLLAIVTLAASVWLATQPRELADFTQPSQAQDSAFTVGAPGATSTEARAGSSTELASPFAIPAQGALLSSGMVDRTSDAPRLRQGPPLAPFLP